MFLFKKKNSDATEKKSNNNSDDLTPNNASNLNNLQSSPNTINKKIISNPNPAINSLGTIIKNLGNKILKKEKVNEKKESKKENKKEDSKTPKILFSEHTLSKNSTTNRKEDSKILNQKQQLNEKEKESSSNADSSNSDDGNTIKSNSGSVCYTPKAINNIIKNTRKKHNEDKICCIYGDKDITNIAYNGYKLVKNNTTNENSMVTSTPTSFVIKKTNKTIEYSITYQNFAGHLEQQLLNYSESLVLQELLNNTLFADIANITTAEKKVVNYLKDTCHNTQLQWLPNTYYLVGCKKINKFERIKIYVNENNNVRFIECDTRAHINIIDLYRKYEMHLLNDKNSEETKKTIVHCITTQWLNENGFKEMLYELMGYVNINPMLQDICSKAALFPPKNESEDDIQEQNTLPRDVYRNTVSFSGRIEKKEQIDDWKKELSQLELMVPCIGERINMLLDIKKNRPSGGDFTISDNGKIYIENNFKLGERDTNFHLAMLIDIMWRCWHLTLEHRKSVSFADFLDLAYYYKDDKRNINKEDYEDAVRNTIQTIWREIFSIIENYSQTIFSSGIYTIQHALQQVTSIKEVEQLREEICFFTVNQPIGSYWIQFVFKQNTYKKKLKMELEKEKILDDKFNDKENILVTNISNEKKRKEKIKITASQIRDLIYNPREVVVNYHAHNLSLKVGGLTQKFFDFPDGANVVVNNLLVSPNALSLMQNNNDAKFRFFIGNTNISGGECFKKFFNLAYHYDIPGLTIECEKIVNLKAKHKNVEQLLNEKRCMELTQENLQKNIVNEIEKKKDQEDIDDVVYEKLLTTIEIKKDLSKKINSKKEEIKKELVETTMTNEKSGTNDNKLPVYLGNNYKKMISQFSAKNFDLNDPINSSKKNECLSSFLFTPTTGGNSKNTDISPSKTKNFKNDQKIDQDEKNLENNIAVVLQGTDSILNELGQCENDETNNGDIDKNNNKNNTLECPNPFY